ncbi:MAG: DUF2203 family protein [Tumebacillaceae bacterium]
MAKKYFTLEEANALLPQLETMLRNLQEMKRDIQLNYRRLQETKMALTHAPNITSDSFFQEEAELEFLIFTADQLLKQINALGVEVKDVDTGLCDFYSLYHGQEVYLCWRLGEPCVRFWHGVYEGFLGRREIEYGYDFFDNE